MNCLFCKNVSDASKSVEHIIPESLGNKEHVLPKGIVCDDCNNYFAVKVEKELLDQPYFRSIRHRGEIESKKGVIPFEKGFSISPVPTPIEIHRIDGKMIINYLEEHLISKIAEAKSGAFIIPRITAPDPDNKILSRFLAKVAIEALVYWIKDDAEWITEIVTKQELDEIRNYARYGKGVNLWPYHQRRIYDEEDCFLNSDIMKEPYEVLHEFTFHYSEAKELFFIIAIMGIEYSINLAGPEIETYIELLKKNGNKSFLSRDFEKKMS